MKNTRVKILAALVAILALSACEQRGNTSVGAAVAKTAEQVWLGSMQAKNQAGLDRLTQNDLQRACSNRKDWVADESQRNALQAAAKASVTYPADGQYLGDWRRGEVIASNGKGLQWNDDPSKPNGGNCYACHEMSPDEVAFGTIGPSLKNYGGMRGQSEPVLQYTWAKLWNPHVYTLCSHMPRFGDAGILTEQQLKDVMAFLLDPASPVNQ